MTLQAGNFEEFFCQLYPGKKPFPWQQKLAEQVAFGHWPRALALPTAAGKTACLDIGIFALACQANLPAAERTAPRRIFFVVDRRVIVDEAYERAQQLAEMLKKATGGILLDVADRLRQLAHTPRSKPPLGCHQLRGGVYRDDSWAKSPAQPTIIASTVDQIGSRMLYRSYGLSSGLMRPIHAGLAANDSLIILDEAHCARPFLDTALAIQRYRTWMDDEVGSKLKNPFNVVIVSATPPPGIEESDMLRHSEADRQDPVLGPRLDASKPTELIEARKAKGEQALEKLSERLADEAEKLQQRGAKSTAILVNRVATARMVYEELQQRNCGYVMLLTGRMRSIDRDELVDSLRKRLDECLAGKVDHPLFVVATQCLEVGANLDFDAMVSECASLDSLRQRFGRLNRMGRDIDAAGTIVIRADQINAKDEDPVYGPSLGETWRWLQSQSSEGRIDMGFSAMTSLIDNSRRDEPELLIKLAPLVQPAPIMLPAHLDRWVQTAPEPCPDPDVAIFLHGPDRGGAEVQVLWRADLTSEAKPPNEEGWIEAISVCPPTSAECMSVPLHAFRRWMSSDDATLQMADTLTDVIGEKSDADADDKVGTSKRVVRWSGPLLDDTAVLTDPKQIRPGDTIVIPARSGGWDVFGHIPVLASGAELIDRGDECNLLARGKVVLRLHPALVDAWPASTARDELRKLISPIVPEDINDVRPHLRQLAQDISNPQWLRVLASAIVKGPRSRLDPHPTQGVVLSRPKRIKPRQDHETFTDEDDSSSDTVSVALADHVQGVEAKVAQFGRCCGLPQDLIDDLELAARCHDLGKADPRFQALLRGGQMFSAAAGELLAKSGNLPQSPDARKRARSQSGYPSGGRHELLSVKLVQSDPQVLATAKDPELVLYLIASHHGHCRPFAPIVNDPNPVPVSVPFNGHAVTVDSTWTGLERLDSGVPERFWRLVRKYGWWGLAWLETILRLADHRRSEDEQKPEEDRDESRD